MKRYLALAEGYSGDDHYGKTTYGVIRYASEPVVAVLDSTRAGKTIEGIPIVASVADALEYEPTVALVGVALAGGRLPPVWRGILREAIEAGLDVEAGMHEFLADDPELAELAREHGVELRDYRRPPADLSVPTGENLTHGASVVLTVGSDCAVGKKTIAVELDRAARERGLSLGVRAHRPDRNHDRRLGDRRGRRGVRLPCRRGGEAGGRGRAPG